jgi:hypothetical protein
MCIQQAGPQFPSRHFGKTYPQISDLHKSISISTKLKKEAPIVVLNTAQKLFTKG